MPFLQLGSKAANDKEEHWHHLLRRMTTIEQTTNFRNNLCSLFHAKVEEPPYWTSFYTTPALDKNRLSLLSLTLLPRFGK